MPHRFPVTVTRVSLGVAVIVDAVSLIRAWGFAGREVVEWAVDRIGYSLVISDFRAPVAVAGTTIVFLSLGAVGISVYRSRKTRTVMIWATIACIAGVATAIATSHSLTSEWVPIADR